MTRQLIACSGDTAALVTERDRLAGEVTRLTNALATAHATPTELSENVEGLRHERDEILAQIEQARADQGVAAAGVIAEAQEEAHRMIEAAQATTNVEESEVLTAGLSDTEVEVMRAAASDASKVAEQQQQAEAKETRKAADQEAAELERAELDRMTADQQVGSERLARRIVEMEAAEQEEAELSRVDEDGAEGRTRYERKSAKLPTMGEDASKVVGSLEGLRKSLRGA